VGRFAREAAGEGRIGAEAHVTAIPRSVPACAGARESLSDGRHRGSQAAFPLHGGAQEAASASRSKASRESAESGAGARQRGQRFGSIGSTRDNDAARQPGRAHRSERGVVKRQTHRSFGIGCKPGRQGRGASLEEKPVTHEARVLAVRKWEAEVGRTHRAHAPGRAARQIPGCTG